MHTEALKVLNYWFGALDQTPEWYGRKMRLWFMGGKAVDDEIRTQFGALVEDAETGKLDDWKNSPKECLALLVLLDQFALNIYRNEARGYRCSEAAIPLARHLLAKRWNSLLSPAENIFVYMPLEHSESMEDQETCLAGFEEMLRQSPMELKEIMQGSLDYAERHRKVVKRFGRFPHRNEALGRKSTEEELKFLASSEAPF